MEQGLIFDAVLAAVDQILELPLKDPSKANFLQISVAARMQGLISSKTAAVGFLGSTSISPPAFLLVLGIYIVILTAILTNYVVEIELGDDKLAKRVAIASAFPVSLGVFTAGAILGGQVLGSMID